jgi:hypothetical protein
VTPEALFLATLDDLGERLAAARELEESLTAVTVQRSTPVV